MFLAIAVNNIIIFIACHFHFRMVFVIPRYLRPCYFAAISIFASQIELSLVDLVNVVQGELLTRIGARGEIQSVLWKIVRA